MATQLCSFEDNLGAQSLFGPHNAHLDRIEAVLGVETHAIGGVVQIEGEEEAVETARAALEGLYEKALRGEPILTADVDAALRLSGDGEGADPSADDSLVIQTRKRRVAARSKRQGDYISLMKTKELVLGLGPAGTGKTYLAVVMAVSMLEAGRVDRIILSRPAVEAGERIGFLPGDMKEKVDPFLRPLYDGLYDCMAGNKVMRAMEDGVIEIAPLAFMRGRTLANAFVILDEAQNATPTQMKMFLTRLGENSRMVVTGDLTQVDLPLGAKSGLADSLSVLEPLSEVGMVRFDHTDVVRHDLVTKIVQGYDKRDGVLKT